MLFVAPHTWLSPVIFPIVAPPPDDTVLLIAKVLSLEEPLVLFLATIVNHILAPGVSPVTVWVVPDIFEARTSHCPLVEFIS
jgi:hypothetical protein